MADESRSKRKWIILLILILLLISGIILYLYLVYFSAAIQPASNLNQAANTNAGQNINTNINIAPALPPALANLTPEQQTQAKKEGEVLFFALPFAERFGTYSNQSGFNNLDELNPLMTQTMVDWVRNTYKADLVKAYADVVYYGIETKAISSKFNSQADTKAEILVKTQRSEFKDSPTNPRIFYQDIILKLVKQNEAWKVDGAYWQK